MKRLVPFTALALAACGGNERPAIEVRTVQVPVPQPCLAMDEIPDEPPLIGDLLTGEAAHDLRIVSQSALALRLWGQAMHGPLVACAEG